jgi:excinuclease ABC subunit A
MSETLNVLRLMMSRLGSHLCPNGHRIGPSIAKFAEEIVCSVCGARFEHPGAESFAFNSYGACPARQGLGVRSEVDETTVVPDPDKTIEEGARCCRGTPAAGGCRCMPRASSGFAWTSRTARSPSASARS